MASCELTYEQLNSLDVWRAMPTTTLEAMRTVRLMNRIDTKYVLSTTDALRLLDTAAREGYRVQIIGDIRACRYDTLYYDTDERDMYLVHHNRKLARQKIRTRTYVESGISFLEIKNKSNRGRTRKKRVEIARTSVDNFVTDATTYDFYDKYARYDRRQLSPALSTEFTRITLVNGDFTERITIDLNLCYRDVRSGHSASVEQMVIVELKQDGRYTSTMKRLLRDLRIQPMKVSKYCLGTALTVEHIRANRFKEKIRRIEKRLSATKS